MLKLIIKTAIIAALAGAVGLTEGALLTLQAYERGRMKVFWDCAQTGVVLEGKIVMVCAVTTLDQPTPPLTGNR